MAEQDLNNTDALYFVVKVVPVNGPAGKDIKHHTWSKKPGGNVMMSAGQTLPDLAVGRFPFLQRKAAFRFEVWDMIRENDSPDAVTRCLESEEGQSWLEDAVDYAIFQIRAKPV